jgi:hypothetical protein
MRSSLASRSKAAPVSTAGAIAGPRLFFEPVEVADVNRCMFMPQYLKFVAEGIFPE